MGKKVIKILKKIKASNFSLLNKFFFIFLRDNFIILYAEKIKIEKNKKKPKSPNSERNCQ